MDILLGLGKKLGQIASLDFLGPKHAAADARAVEKAAAHDEQASVVLKIGNDIRLVNGSGLDRLNLHAGDDVMLVDGLSLKKAEVLYADDGTDESSAIIDRLLTGVDQALAQQDLARAGDLYQQAINLGQDVTDQLAIADHAGKCQAPLMRSQAYVRACDLAEDVPSLLKVARHATANQDPFDAAYAFTQAIERTSDRKTLLAIASSADAAGLSDVATTARGKGSPTALA